MGTWVLAIAHCAELVTLITRSANASPYYTGPPTGLRRGISIRMVAIFRGTSTCKWWNLYSDLLLHMGNSILSPVPQRTVLLKVILADMPAIHQAACCLKRVVRRESL